MDNVQKIENRKVIESGSTVLNSIDIVSVERDGVTSKKAVLSLDGLSDDVFLTMPEMLKAFGVMAKGILTDTHVQLLAFYDVKISWSAGRLCEVGNKYSPWIQDEFSEDFVPKDDDFVDLHGITLKFVAPDKGLLEMLKEANSATDAVLYDREAEREERKAKKPAKRINAEDIDDAIIDDTVEDESTTA